MKKKKIMGVVLVAILIIGSLVYFFIYDGKPKNNQPDIKNMFRSEGVTEVMFTYMDNSIKSFHTDTEIDRTVSIFSKGTTYLDEKSQKSVMKENKKFAIWIKFVGTGTLLGVTEDLKYGALYNEVNETINVKFSEEMTEYLDFVTKL